MHLSSKAAAFFWRHSLAITLESLQLIPSYQAEGNVPMWIGQNIQIIPLARDGRVRAYLAVALIGAVVGSRFPGRAWRAVKQDPVDQLPINFLLQLSMCSCRPILACPHHHHLSQSSQPLSFVHNSDDTTTWRLNL